MCFEHGTDGAVVPTKTRLKSSIELHGDYTPFNVNLIVCRPPKSECGRLRADVTAATKTVSDVRVSLFALRVPAHSRHRHISSTDTRRYHSLGVFAAGYPVKRQHQHHTWVHAPCHTAAHL